MQTEETLGLTAKVVAAYVGNNSLQDAEFPGLILAVHTALAGLDREAVPKEPPAAKPTPAQVRRSITQEALISFEDGRPYKTLRRHLNLRGLTPETYRAKWGLSADYPMTAQVYSEKRSALAHAFGLGRKKAAAAEMSGTGAAEDVSVPKRRGRRKEPAA